MNKYCKFLFCTGSRIMYMTFYIITFDRMRQLYLTFLSWANNNHCNAITGLRNNPDTVLVLTFNSFNY